MRRAVDKMSLAVDGAALIYPLPVYGERVRVRGGKAFGGSASAGKAPHPPAGAFSP
jgi:hypothetical protein